MNSHSWQNKYKVDSTTPTSNPTHIHGYEAVMVLCNISKLPVGNSVLSHKEPSLMTMTSQPCRNSERFLKIVYTQLSLLSHCTMSDNAIGLQGELVPPDLSIQHLCKLIRIGHCEVEGEVLSSVFPITHIQSCVHCTPRTAAARPACARCCRQPRTSGEASAGLDSDLGPKILQGEAEISSQTPLVVLESVAFNVRQTWPVVDSRTATDIEDPRATDEHGRDRGVH